MSLILRWHVPDRRLATRWRGPMGMSEAIARQPLDPIAAVVGPAGDGSSTIFPPLEVAADATAPVPDGGTGSAAWSTLVNEPVFWDGMAWRTIAHFAGGVDALPNWVPPGALVVTDFVEGRYWRHDLGICTLEDIWETGAGYNYPWDPSYIHPGMGMIGSQVPQVVPAILAMLDPAGNGFTAVNEYHLAQGNDASADAQLGMIFTTSTYENEWGGMAVVRAPENPKVGVLNCGDYDGPIWTADIPTIPFLASHRVASSISAAGTAVAINGVATLTRTAEEFNYVPKPDPSWDMLLPANFDHSTAVVYCERIIFYPLQDPSTLDALSGPIPAPVNITPPTVTGIAEVGQTLSASTGSWGYSPSTFAFQWRGDGNPIPGASGATFAVTESQTGQTITVAVVATNASGTSDPAISGPTAVVPGSSSPSAFDFGAAGPNSAYFDFTDLATMRQGTTEGSALAAPGAAVGFVLDKSGKGNHLVQTNAANQFAAATDRHGMAVLRSGELYAAAKFYDLPALTVDRRAHSWWLVCRLRSTLPGGDRPFCSFGPGLTDCLYDTNGTGGGLKLRTFGTSAQNAGYLNSSVMTIVVSAGAGGLKVRINGVESSLAALSSGSLTGGRLFARTDGQLFAGDAYEYGLLDRELNSGEIAEIEAYAQARYGSWPTYGNLVMVGDSLTEGQTDLAAMGWPWRLGDALGDNWRCVSEGASGRYLGSIAPAASSTAGLYDAGFNKNVAILMAGVNDITGGASATDCLGYAQTWLTAMKGAGFSTIVIGVAKTDINGWNATKEGHRTDYNAGLSGLTGIDTVIQPDSLAELSNPNDPTYYQGDKLHWKDPTFAAVAAAAEAAVLAL